jgi:hypothetical protein
MNRRRLVVSIASIGVLVAIVAPGGAGAAPEKAKHSATLNTGTSPYKEDVSPIAASSTYLVYKAVPVTASGGASFAGGSLYAKTVKGAPRKLGSEVSDTGFGLAGDLLTGNAGGASPTIDWWNLKTHKSGHTKVATGRTYLSAAPDGYLYAAQPGNVVFDFNVTKKKAKKLGDPIAHGGAIGEAITDQTGVVIAGGGNAAEYMRWAKPGHFTALKTDPSTYSNLDCYSLVGTAVGCTASATKTFAGAILRLNTNGKTAPVVTPAPPNTFFEAVSVSAASTAWLNGANSIMSSEPAKHKKATAKSKKPVRFLTSGLGSFVVGSGTNLVTSLDRTTSAKASRKPVAKGGPAPAEAGAVAVTAGRVAYDADQHGPDSVFSRSLSSSGVTVGGPSLLVSHATQNGLSVSGATTIATVGVKFTKENYFAKSPLGSAKLGHPGSVPFAAEPEASGDRVLYDTGDTSVPNLYDFVTHKSTSLPGLAPNANNAALWGDYLVFVKADGSIWRADLSTGKATMLRAPIAGAYVQVYAWANDVGWNISGGGVSLHQFVDTSSAKPPVSLGTASIVGLSSDGVITEVSTKGGYYVDALRPYTGHSSKVITSIDPTDVSVDSGHVGWVDESGNGHVITTPGKRVKDQPRYLGDASAPASYKPGSKSWRGYIPTSAALTSCHVIIRRGSKTVATLACDKSLSAEGVADVSWSGKVKGKRAAAGSYTWTLSAKGRDGPVLAADGTSAKVTGTINVT